MKTSRYTEEQIQGLLERLIGERGRPESVRSDNGPEFTSRQMLAWTEEWKVGLVHIQPGRPMQNGHVESFHGRLRDECLNASWFRTMNDVRYTLATWREEYNCDRPHRARDYRTPQCLLFPEIFRKPSVVHSISDRAVPMA
jgi:putative transposase